MRSACECGVHVWIAPFGPRRGRFRANAHEHACAALRASVESRAARTGVLCRAAPRRRVGYFVVDCASSRSAPIRSESTTYVTSMHALRSAPVRRAVRASSAGHSSERSTSRLLWCACASSTFRHPCGRRAQCCSRAVSRGCLGELPAPVRPAASCDDEHALRTPHSADRTRFHIHASARESWLPCFSPC